MPAGWSERRRRRIRKRAFGNVRKYGWHNYRIYGGPSPPWSYTIGFHETWAAPELVLAGSAFVVGEVTEALQALARRIPDENPAPGTVWDIAPVGEVAFREVEDSWKHELLLGDVDYYDGSAFPALQVVPLAGETIDVPDMSSPLTDILASPWRWLKEPWPYAIPEAIHVLTDTVALYGGPVTYVGRTKPVHGIEWNAWASVGTDVPEREHVRLVPFGTLLAVDDTLAETLDLEPEQHAARGHIGDPWRIWDAE